MNDREYLPLSWLAQVNYCSRRAALLLNERVWNENVETAKGRTEHERVHTKRIEKRGNLVKLYEYEVVSEILGIVGKCDCIEATINKNGCKIPAVEFPVSLLPIEYKHGTVRDEMEYKIQLCAQAMCLEEMYQTRIFKGELFFIVDSDDFLTEDAIECINNIHKKYINREDICGYSFLRMFPSKKINGKPIGKNEIIDDYINIRIKRNDMESDKAEVWKTKCLKEYPFPEFENEKFLGEDIVWLQLALKYKMVFCDKAIYISEYLNSGLTKNRRINNIKSPQGCFIRAKILLFVCKKRKIYGKYLVKSMLQYQIYARFAEIDLRKAFKECNQKMLYMLMFLPAKYLYKKWRRKYVN